MSRFADLRRALTGEPSAAFGLPDAPIRRFVPDLFTLGLVRCL